MKTISFLTTLLTRGLFIISLLTLIACGTLEASIRVEDTTPPATVGQQPDYVFGDTVVLRGYSLPSLEMAAGSELLLRLYWRVTVQPFSSYALGIGLRGPEGMLVWQHSDDDISWVPGRLVTEHRLRVPRQVSEGDYGLEVWLYDPESGERVSIEGAEGSARGPVHLATLYLTSSSSSSPPSTRPPATRVPVVTATSMVEPSD